MKLVVLLICLSVASAAVYAMDLPAIARREKMRRSLTAGKPVRAYGDRDLERYKRERGSNAAPPPRVAPTPTAPKAARDFTKEKVHWRKETLRHERELSRIDAGIRRLQWRLQERRSRRRNGERLTEDPVVGLLEDSIKNLQEERRYLDDRFQDRARKDGALPGWLR